jgi:hypothetical protein
MADKSAKRTADKCEVSETVLKTQNLPKTQIPTSQDSFLSQQKRSELFPKNSSRPRILKYSFLKSAKPNINIFLILESGFCIFDAD